MPGQYWAYGFYVLIGVPLLLVIFAMMIDQARWIAALGGLPAGSVAAAGSPGAVFRGRLLGAPLLTPLGQPAVAWVGMVDLTIRQGKGSMTAEKCRRGSLGGLSLATGSGTAAIVEPDLAAVDTGTDIWTTRSRRPRYWLGTTAKVSPVPDSILDDCHLNRQPPPKGSWSYVEHWAPAGSAVEIAGCAAPGAIAPCRAGVAAGHLAVGGMRALVRHLTGAAMTVAALLTLIMSSFTVIAGLGAVLALRRAAKQARGGARP